MSRIRRIDIKKQAAYESAFLNMLGHIPPCSDGKVLFATWIDSMLGPILIISDETGLDLLDFLDRNGLEKKVERLRKQLKIGIVPGRTNITNQIIEELENYFKGNGFAFKTPYFLMGSDFQRSVWKALQAIPSGETRSYLDISKTIGRNTAYRAVANANGANQLAIIIPCHRVINHNGELGGYGGGLSRKRWLLQHEKVS